ncbi:MAG: ATP-dependent DNA helicase DinG [Pseudomonadales bacterium]|nr:ATP-dependent DNA helicase DinG [Pseudomonadales bacterium]
MTALTDVVKDEIQTAYRTWLAARDFKPRRGQRQMIAQIARSLSADADRVAVVEAGTGTGKTAAYCLAAIPVAQSLNKTIVLSTATVALQEQVILQDLPDIQERAGLKFSLTLAKGRGRYLCLKRLDDHLKYQDQQEIPIFDVTDEDHTVLYQEMLNRFSQGQWDGEVDSWSEGLSGTAWSGVTTDHRGCSNNRCSFFKQCPFFRARANLEDSDVIVANHDLVLADLALGGGAVLPEPEDCIYILDEAHHIAEKTQNHFSSNARINGTIQWLDNVNKALGSVTTRFGQSVSLTSLATGAAAEADALSSHLYALSDGLNTLPFESKDDDREVYRFPQGDIPGTLMDLAMAALPSLGKLCVILEQAHEQLQEAVAGNSDWANAYEAEDWLVPIGQLQSRALATRALFEDYALGAGRPRRYARWLNRTPYDVEMVSAPIEPGNILQEVLWDRCYGALCTSATITALGRFDRFIERVGLDPSVSTMVIQSPFNYPEVATFHVPPMRSDPRDFDAHTEEVTALIPKLLQRHVSALVLFTSWRQLNAVIGGLDKALAEELLVQGEGSKQALLAEHRRRVDDGQPSYLFGVASFSEGLDLPGDYCRHVVIVKLPFSVPDDPVDQAIAEWAEAQGRNPFYEISVPDASLKLVQACGRLIRSESDYGTISMLDKRIVTQRYGKALIESLPPFRLDLPTSV